MVFLGKNITNDRGKIKKWVGGLFENEEMKSPHLGIFLALKNTSFIFIFLFLKGFSQ